MLGGPREQYRAGVVQQETGLAFEGTASLAKLQYGHPNGGYKQFEAATRADNADGVVLGRLLLAC